MDGGPDVDNVSKQSTRGGSPEGRGGGTTYPIGRFRMGRRTRNGGFGELGLVKLRMNHTFNCLVFIPFAHRGAAFFPASLSET